MVSLALLGAGPESARNRGGCCLTPTLTGYGQAIPAKAPFPHHDVGGSAGCREQLGPADHRPAPLVRLAAGPAPFCPGRPGPARVAGIDRGGAPLVRLRFFDSLHRTAGSGSDAHDQPAVCLAILLPGDRHVPHSPALSVAQTARHLS